MIPDPGFPPTIPALIERFASRYGDAEAIVRDGKRVSFAGLNVRSATIARALMASGATAGSRIAILAPPGPEFVLAVLAAGRIGAVAVPLSTLYQAPELQWVLANAGIAHLIAADTFLRHDYLERLEEALPELAGKSCQPLYLDAAPRLRTIHVIGTGTRKWSRPFSELEREPTDVGPAMLAAAEKLVTPSSPFCIIHTSGSTAHPKGIVHGHGPLVRHSWQMGMDFCPFGPGDRIVTTRAMFWVAGFVATLFYALNNGSCLVTTTDGSPQAILGLIENEQATGLAGDSGWFDVLRESDPFREAGLDVVRLNMDSAGLVRDGRFLGGQLQGRFGSPAHLPNPRFARTFGMTETLGGHTSLRADELLPEDLPSWQGKPVPGVDVRIVDPQTRQPVAIGEIGELLVRGYCLMLGIDGKERRDVFDDEGFYPTGDLCRVDDRGFLKFESRLGEMVKVHGANVAPLEVELAMTGLLGIEKAAVVGVPREGDTVLAAAVLMAPDRQLDEDAVRTHLKRNLSSYKVPARIFAFDAETLPATGSGKVIKHLLLPLVAEKLSR